jgi:membrane fusion protein (multidrug efflux system)
MEDNIPKKKKNKVMPIILIVIIVLSAFFGIQKYIYSQHHEDTDDAQFEGDISPVLPRVSGFVTMLNVSDNMKVKEGDTLVKLDDRDYKIKLDQAQSALDNAIANVAVVKANNVASFANYETAKANLDAAKIKVWKATEDYKRYEKLLADKAITQKLFDDTKADKESIEAQVEVANKQVAAAQRQDDAAGQQISYAQSIVAQRQADLDFAKLQLSYTTLVAPVSGIVSKKNVELGQFVQAGQSLFAIVLDSDVWVVANFKETQLEKMKVNQTVDIVVDAYKDKKIEGYVHSFSAATGARFSLLPPDNASGNFVKVVQRVPVKIKLKADKEILNLLRPGLSVRVVVNI